MGSFPGTCGFSGLSIAPGQGAVLFFLEHCPDFGQDHFYHWRTITPPVFCAYMDYGRYKFLPTEPARYVKAVMDSVTVDLVPGDDGKFDRWEAVSTKLDNLLTCVIRRDVFDLLLARLDPHEVHVLNERLSQGYLDYQKAAASLYQRGVTLEHFIQQHLERGEDNGESTPLSFYLAFGQRGRLAPTVVLEQFVTPLLRSDNLCVMLDRLQKWDAIDTLMRVTQRPWRPSCHTAPQEGNEPILGPIFLNLAKLVTDNNQAKEKK